MENQETQNFLLRRYVCYTIARMSQKVCAKGMHIVGINHGMEKVARRRYWNVVSSLAITHHGQ